MGDGRRATDDYRGRATDDRRPAWLVATATWGITAAMGLFSWPNVLVQASLTFITVVVSAYLGSRIYKDTEEVSVTCAAGRHAIAGARA